MRNLCTSRISSAIVVPCLAAALLVAAPAAAQLRNRPNLPARAQGAQRVVVATVAQVETMPLVNEFGDQLIVSRATLAVDEVWKGPSMPTMQIDVEGGTLGGLTLTVSDMDSIEPGERGVFFIERSPSGRNVPHRRGLGIVKLNDSDIAEDEGLSLDDIRASIGRP